MPAETADDQLQSFRLQRQGTFGPGSFVWFPEGMLMEHGATDDAAVTTLFITNKPFDIRYALEDEQDSPTP
jgi:hypothetical protein